MRSRSCLYRTWISPTRATGVHLPCRDREEKRGPTPNGLTRLALEGLRGTQGRRAGREFRKP